MSKSFDVEIFCTLGSSLNQFFVTRYNILRELISLITPRDSFYIFSFLREYRTTWHGIDLRRLREYKLFVLSCGGLIFEANREQLRRSLSQSDSVYFGLKNRFLSNFAHESDLEALSSALFPCSRWRSIWLWAVISHAKLIAISWLETLTKFTCKI